MAPLHLLDSVGRAVTLDFVACRVTLDIVDQGFRVTRVAANPVIQVLAVKAASQVFVAFQAIPAFAV